MEEEYADIYYVDSRNAVVRDHTRRPSSGWRPRAQPAPMPPTRTVYVPQAPGGFASQVQQPLIYSQPISATGTAAMLLGKLTAGQIIEMVAQVFAALQSLPGAPVATQKLETDVANMVLYQGALASHAKRDEQVRTLGGIVAKLVG